MVRFISAVVGLLAAGSAIAAPAADPAQTTALEERQASNLFSAIVNPIIAVLEDEGVFGGAPPLCSNYFDSTYYFMSGRATNGIWWQSCWQNDTNLVGWNTNDTNIAKCLTNLHYTQADTCISVAGSMCDVDNYVANGGRLQNMRELIAGSGTQSAAQMTGEESVAMQTAISNFGERLVTGLGDLGPFFILSTDNTFTEPLNDRDQMQMNWIGDEAC